MHLPLKLIILILSLVMPSSVFATEIYELHRNVRALGMGNAFISLAENETALFINPAGLARNGGFFWTIADPAAGLNSLDTELLDAFEKLTDDSTFEDGLNDLMGEPIWSGVNAKTAFVAPYFGIAYYTDLDTSILVDNPVAPQIQANLINDIGLAIGAGFSFGPVDFGGVVKRIERTGGRATFGPSVVSGIIEGSGSTDDIFDVLEAEGTGYSLDLGLNFAPPAPFSPTLSVVWKNVGNTSFRAGAGQLRPPTDPQEWSVGGSMVFDAFLVHIIPSIDVKHIEDSDEQIGKKIHLGVELGLPLLDLRAGYHQGYLSYGAGIDLGFIQVDAASWGVELGEYPGQFEDRRYMLQATLRLGLDLGFGSSGSSSSADSGSSSASAFGSGSSSRSRGGGRRGKVRR